MSFTSRSATGLAALATAGLFAAVTGVPAAMASTPGTMSSTLSASSASPDPVSLPVDSRPYGPFTGSISPISGYQQNGYGMESAWIVGNQDAIYASCPGSLAPVGPQQGLATVTGELLQSNQGRQLTSTLVATNDANGCL